MSGAAPVKVAEPKSGRNAVALATVGAVTRKATLTVERRRRPMTGTPQSGVMRVQRLDGRAVPGGLPRPGALAGTGHRAGVQPE